MNTIKTNKEITLILKKGKTYKFPFLNLVIYKDLSKEIKGEAAFLAGKKNGNAVWRNKCKRRLREIYKEINFSNDINKILLIANQNLLDYKYEDIVKECKNLKYE